jgi:hypothetical protein
MSRKTRRSRRGPVLVLVTLLLAAGAFVLWSRSGDPVPAAAGTPTATPTSAAPTSAPSGTVPSESTPSEDPATSGEKAAEETETPVQPVPSDSPGDAEAAGESGGLAPVAVSLTYAAYDASTAAVVVGGYAADVVEVDATCTLVLRRNGVELRGESLGTPSVTTTDCGEVRVGGEALTSGTWQAVLGYTSGTSVGESGAVEVEVP